MNETIKENIRLLRKERQMTQEQLAEAMGVSGAAVSKWENGQSAPDLSALIALADYFEVSVDTLLGHRLRSERLNGMIEEARTLIEARRMTEAEELAGQILRNYPNSLEAAEGCASIYYRLYIVGSVKAHMEKAIEQTRRLFVLGKDQPESQKLEWFTELGNQYEMLGEWQQALKYYREGNVSGHNDHNIASCLLKQGRREEGISLLSEVTLKRMHYQFMDTILLAEAWEAAGEPEKACRALEWTKNCMDGMGFDARMRMILRAVLAGYYEEAGQMEKADAERHGLAALAGETEEPADFLNPEKPIELIGNLPGSHHELRDMLLSAAGGENQDAENEG